MKGKKVSDNLEDQRYNEYDPSTGENECHCREGSLYTWKTSSSP